MVKNRLDKLRS